MTEIILILFSLVALPILLLRASVPDYGYRYIAIVLLFLGSVLPTNADQVSINPYKDNTIYSDGSNVSNGQGNFLFSGKVGQARDGAIRRALLAFNIAEEIPAGATITGVSLKMNMNRSSKTTLYSIGLYSLEKDWGEGDSKAGGEEGGGDFAAVGDATWEHTSYDTSSWDALGGDYSVNVSAEVDVGDVGFYTWTSQGMINDVQRWLDNPDGNFGWILIGNEISSGASKRFNSRNNSENPPLLTVTYELILPTNRELWEEEYFEEGEVVSDSDDLDEDGLNNLLEYAFGLDPKTNDRAKNVYSVGFDSEGGLIIFTFIRDAQADDLIYRLETSSDLQDWNTIAESIGGSMTSGSGLIAETPVGGGLGFVRVEVKDPIAVSTSESRFARLVVVRQ